MPNRPGRPSKFTEYTKATILAYLREGNYRIVACQAAGISVEAFCHWMNDSRPEFVQFQQEVQKAEGEAETTLIGRVVKASTTSWQAAAWMLERKNPDRWGQKMRIEVTEMLRKETSRLAEEYGLDPEEVLASAEALLARIDQ